MTFTGMSANGQDAPIAVAAPPRLERLKSTQSSLPTRARGRSPKRRKRLSFAQAILAVFAQGGEQITDDAALAGLDLGGDRHAGRQVDHLVLDPHLATVERDARRVSGPLVIHR